MADEQLLEQLMKRHENFNAWRRSNRHVPLNFEGADLREYNLYKFELPKACFDQAKLTEVDLQFSDCTHASFVGASMARVRLAHTKLCRAKLDGADLTGVDFKSSDLTNTSLCGADLRDTSLGPQQVAQIIAAHTLEEIASIRNLETVRGGAQLAQMAATYRIWMKKRTPGITLPERF